MVKLDSTGHTAVARFWHVLVIARNVISRKYVVACILGLVIWPPALLRAACPPLAKPQELSLLEQLAKSTPKDRPLTDAELLKLLKSGDIKLPPLQVLPPNGPSPLTVNVAWSFLSDDSPSQIDIDLDGSGTFKPIESRFDPHSGIQEGKLRHTYDREGTFRVTLRVRNAKGDVTTHSKQVLVMTQAAFETSLQKLWADYKSSLQKGDITDALECMHSSARSRYQKIMAEVLKSGTPINQVLTDIRFVRLFGSAAEFEMLRMGPAGEFSYLVLFELDIDGVWRIRSM